jgi:hypothetical protein
MHFRWCIVAIWQYSWLRVVFWLEWRKTRWSAEREKRAERRKGCWKAKVTIEVRQMSVPVI